MKRINKNDNKPEMFTVKSPYIFPSKHNRLHIPSNSTSITYMQKKKKKNTKKNKRALNKKN
jgi:hypothetical protein